MGGSLACEVIAANCTHALGKSAELYFFAGEIRKSEEFGEELPA